MGVVMAVEVLLLDDHPAYRAGVRTILERTTSGAIVEVGTVSKAVEVVRERTFDLAIVDMIVPESSGVVLVRELHALQPECRILALSMIDEGIRIAEMLRAGATGYVLKSQPVEDLLNAIEIVLDGYRYLPPDLAIPSELLTDEPLPLDRLTRRERTVFDLLVRGFGSRGAAERLAIARRTIDEHRRRIMHKLGARSIVDLIRIAMQSGSLDRSDLSFTTK